MADYVESNGHSYVNGACIACGPSIKRQPVSVEASRYTKYEVYVEASGKGLSYQWYYKDASMSAFVPSVNKTDTYS